MNKLKKQIKDLKAVKKIYENNIFKNYKRLLPKHF